MGERNVSVSAYKVVLILLTQQLAFNHDFRRGVALATFGDKSTAWSGIASALKSLWKQRRGRTEPIALLLILIYLGCILGLGFTTPAIVRLAPIISGEDQYIHTTYYLSEVGVNEYVPPAKSHSPVTLTMKPSVVESFPLVSLLTMTYEGGTVDTYGIEGSTIFDIPSTGGRSTVSASAVHFNVECGYIEGLQQSNPGQYRVQNGTIQYAFHVDDNLADIYVSPANRSINIVSAQPIRQGDISPLTMFVASSVPMILGQEDQANSTAQYSPGILGADINDADIGDDGLNASSNTSFTLQILACDIKVSNGTVPLNTDDSLLASNPEDKRSQLTNNVMESLGFYDPLESDVLYVDDLENTLEIALALVYWRAQYRIFDRETAKKEDNGDLDDDEFKFGIQVQINPYAAWAGLGLSIALSIVAFILSGPVHKTRLIAKPNFVDMLLLLSGHRIVDLKPEEPHHTQSIDSNGALDMDIASKRLYIHAAENEIRLVNKGSEVDQLVQLPQLP
ncbi:hypothetical protein EIP86_003221 [Pleurotus ostreatoroseus]|nr:hypothetical protein EIP86_003221 [Pleurotus ostreatoroseus]